MRHKVAGLSFVAFALTSAHAQAPTSSAVSQLAKSVVGRSDELPLNCLGLNIAMTVDSIRIVRRAAYNADKHYWPVRVAVKGSCRPTNPRESGGMTFFEMQNLLIAKNDFGEWSLADFSLASHSAAFIRVAEPDVHEGAPSAESAPKGPFPRGTIISGDHSFDFQYDAEKRNLELIYCKAEPDRLPKVKAEAAKYVRDSVWLPPHWTMTSRVSSTWACPWNQKQRDTLPLNYDKKPPA